MKKYEKPRVFLVDIDFDEVLLVSSVDEDLNIWDDVTESL